MRGSRSTSPCPTKQQVEKLKLLQTAIKKRTTKPDFMTTYKIHIIISIVIGFLIISYLSFTKQTKEYIIINESEIKSHNSPKCFFLCFNYYSLYSAHKNFHKYRIEMKTLHAYKKTTKNFLQKYGSVNQISYFLSYNFDFDNFFCKITITLSFLEINHNQKQRAFQSNKLICKNFPLITLQLQQNITLMQAKTLFKNDFTQQINVEKCKLSFTDEIPVYYNFKEVYPQCNHQVYNQGNCSSSYSIAVSSSFSDRVCKQNQTQQLSAQNLLSCDGKLNLGCKGGHLTRSADYIIKHGLTTNECHPFRGDDTFKECTNALDQCQRFKAESYCQLQNKDDIKRDILMKGPAVAIMPVYKDFLIYRDGIYQVLDGQPHFHGGQAVKIIGWGEHNGQSYWIIENTWGDTWGINGLAKISIDSFSEMSQQALSINI